MRADVLDWGECAWFIIGAVWVVAEACWPMVMEMFWVAACGGEWLWRKLTAWWV